MEIRFENKVAFITGAAGGIGYAPHTDVCRSRCVGCHGRFG